MGSLGFLFRREGLFVMASEKQIAANRANSKKSTGPRTARGRARSAMNATTHGLTSKTVAKLAEDSIAFQNRLMKRLAQTAVQDDNEEFLTYLNVCQASDFERAHKAEKQRIRDLLEKADETHAEEVHNLGKRLFFDRNGPIDVYGSEVTFFSKQTSPNEGPVDPDDPAILVNKLESSAKGCEWLRDQWEQLKAPLLEQPEGHWVGCHRLKAIRLLGRQPVNAVSDRLVAEVFLASFALREDRLNEFSDLLGSDLCQERLDQLIRSSLVTWPSLAEIEGESEGRAVLLDIVDQNIDRLDELIKTHVQNADHRAEGEFRRLCVDPSPESHNLRKYKEKRENAFLRGQKACQNYKKSNGEGRRGGGREQWRDTQGELIKSTDDRRAARRAGLGNPNLSWAYEPGGPYHRETPAGDRDGTKRWGKNGVNGEHVIAERDHHDTIVCENEANFDEDIHIAQAPFLVHVMANSDVVSRLDTGVKANFGGPEIERVSDEAGAVLDPLSPVAVGCPDGTEGAEAVREHVIGSREHQDSISDEIEANLDDHVNSAQKPVAADVMADSDVLSGLDTGGKANFAEAEFERTSDLEDGRDEVNSGEGGELAEGGPQAEPVPEEKVVVAGRRRDRRGNRTRAQQTKKERKRLRRAMGRWKMERRRAARQNESELKCDARLGGVDSIFPDAVAMACGDHLRSP